MTNLKSHPVPTYAAYGGVPTDAAYGGEPQYIATPFGLVKNDAEYKKYIAQKQQKTSIPNNEENINIPNVENYAEQILGTVADMGKEYFKMKEHGYKNLDDYHHCKANYNAASRGVFGYNTAKTLGDLKETFDYYKNIWYKGLNEQEAEKDKFHDLSVNAVGRLRGDSGLYENAQEACSEYRQKNPAFPKKYW